MLPKRLCTWFYKVNLWHALLFQFHPQPFLHYYSKQNSQRSHKSSRSFFFLAECKNKAEIIFLTLYGSTGLTRSHRIKNWEEKVEYLQMSADQACHSVRIFNFTSNVLMLKPTTLKSLNKVETFIKVKYICKYKNLRYDILERETCKLAPYLAMESSG